MAAYVGSGAGGYPGERRLRQPDPESTGGMSTQRKPATAIALAAVVAFASVCAAAVAAVPKRGHWEGDTGQAGVRPATVEFKVPRKARSIKKLVFDWRAYCVHGGSLDDSTEVDRVPVRHRHHRRTFDANGTYTTKVPGKPLKEKVTEVFHGAFKSRKRAKGHLQVEVDLLDPAQGDNAVGHCSSGKVKWSAQRVKRGLL
jgi:hypothetical protein